MIVSLLSWWWLSVRRHRTAGAGILAVGALLCTAILYWWPWNWLSVPALSHPGNLTLKLGKPDPADKTPGRPLWPRLRIAGLAKNEVASVVLLTNRWHDPAQVKIAHTDFTPRAGNSSPHDYGWLDVRHISTLMPRYPTTDLWPDAYGESQRTIIDIDAKESKLRCRLVLAIHALRKIGEAPLTALAARQHTFPVEEGQSVVLGPRVMEHGATKLYTGQHLHKTLFRHAKGHLIVPPADDWNAPLNYVLVFRDADARELRYKVCYLEYWVDSSFGLLQQSYRQANSVFTQVPDEKVKLGITTQEAWEKQVTVEVFVPELRGVRDFELGPEEMVQAFGAAAK